MAEVFVQIAVSLDGYVEGPGGDLAWFTEDGSFDAFTTATLGSIDGMIFGRRAHETIADFWSTAGGEGAGADLREQARLMTSLPKYVLTHAELRTNWVNSHAVGLGELPRLKANARRPLAVFAGAGVVQAALGAGIVDELRLMTHPVVLGEGTPLFERGASRLDLRLSESQATSSGAVLSRYRIATVGRSDARATAPEVCLPTSSEHAAHDVAVHLS